MFNEVITMSYIYGFSWAFHAEIAILKYFLV